MERRVAVLLGAVALFLIVVFVPGAGAESIIPVDSPIVVSIIANSQNVTYTLSPALGTQLLVICPGFQSGRKVTGKPLSIAPTKKWIKPADILDCRFYDYDAEEMLTVRNKIIRAVR